MFPGRTHTYILNSGSQPKKKILFDSDKKEGIQTWPWSFLPRKKKNLPAFLFKTEIPQ